ncbi:MAG: UDP-N-acetylmuramyl pentapeptide phosphotransferase/UDP-N-acetylglucosamine-1-phosphate transferase [Rubritalea sp.]|jgi:UDP-N-acetylmuramyl pentapeptide phosphotransferase/UDP-N-acetylglucosamine-1-phosphate transferase
MNSTIDNPRTGGVLLITTIIISPIMVMTVAELLPPYLTEGMRWLGYLVVSVCILFVAYFLPETSDDNFSSRKSAITIATIFFFIAVEHLLEGYIDPEFASEDVIIGTALTSSILFYWLSLWSIRGLKKHP